MNISIGDFCIRDFTTDDAPAIARYANNRNIWINLRDSFPHPYTLHDAESFIAQCLEAKPITTFSIASPTEAIGCIGFTPGDDVHRFTAELGYWLAEPFWGKGIMTQAVKSIMAFALGDLKLHRIFAAPYATNPASTSVLKKAGFVCEGTLQSNVFKNGEILDQYLYSYIEKKNI